jgi:hypothetical protein
LFQADPEVIASPDEANAVPPQASTGGPEAGKST